MVPADRLPPRGTVRRRPGRLGDLLDSGVIDELVAGCQRFLITISADRSWRELGDEIRDALCEALLDPEGRAVDAPSAPALETVAAELLAGPVGALWPPRTAGRLSWSRWTAPT